MVIEGSISTTILILISYIICASIGVLLVNTSISLVNKNSSNNKDISNACILKKRFHKCLIAYSRDKDFSDSECSKLLDIVMENDYKYALILNRKTRTLYKKNFCSFEKIDESHYDIIITINDNSILYDVLVYDPYNTEFKFRIKK